ncbi:MAG: hypothetical protein ABI476_09240, partial [Oxalobacteraceae bacterium]
ADTHGKYIASIFHVALFTCWNDYVFSHTPLGHQQRRGPGDRLQALPRRLSLRRFALTLA